MGFAAATNGLIYVFGGWLPAGQRLDDLHSFSPTDNKWSDLTTSTGTRPSTRHQMGFTAAPDGKLYLFGGSFAGLATRTPALRGTTNVILH
jgi:N-acetylneuraminic acid mutarotase